MNTGTAYANNGERANLLSGLRTSGPRLSAHHTQSQAQQQHEQQQLLIQQYLFQQQQQQQQQAMLFGGGSGGVAAQQMFAQQQLQIELQLKQIQMTNLALQEQLFAQQQQALANQQEARKSELPYPTAASKAGSAYRSASASPVVSQGNWVQQQLEENAKDGAQQARWGALRNLQQASGKRDAGSSTPPSSTAATTTPVSAPVTRDWQSERMRFEKTATESPLTPQHRSGAQARSTPTPPPPAAVSHQRNESDASVESIDFSPNRGPTLVLSKPGDEFPDEDDDASSATSGSSNAGDSAGALSPSREGGDPLSPSVEASRRHTVILSGSAALPSRTKKVSNTREPKRSSSVDSQDSTGSSDDSGSSTPSSEKSEPASFDSVNTLATSLSGLSPTSSTKEEKDEKQRAVSTSILKATAASFNPAATAFVPGGGKYAACSGSTPPAAASTVTKSCPSSLSLSSTSTPAATPPAMRFFTAPPSSSTPSFSGTSTPSASSSGMLAIATRQPKGPASEEELAAKNFSGMARRRAVAGLRVAASSANGRTSPLSSPVIGAFPSGSMVMSPPMGSEQTPASPGLMSPTQGSFAAFGQELASRAMKRRSQQMQLTAQQQQGLVNPGLGMF